LIGPIKNRVRGGAGAPRVIFGLRRYTEEETGPQDVGRKGRKGRGKKVKKKKEAFFLFTLDDRG
jgi:hypothetical protein